MKLECNGVASICEINEIRKLLDHGCRLRMLIFLSRFVIVPCKILLEIDSGSAFYHRRFLLYTQTVTHVYILTRVSSATLLALSRRRRQPSRCQKPAAPQLFSIHFDLLLFSLSDDWTLGNKILDNRNACAFTRCAEFVSTI